MEVIHMCDLERDVERIDKQVDGLTQLCYRLLEALKNTLDDPIKSKELEAMLKEVANAT